MARLSITEAGTVQFPMVRHAAEVGWTSLSPKNALALRGGEAGLLFRGVLEEALHRFNPLDDRRRRPLGGGEHPGASVDD